MSNSLKPTDRGWMQWDWPGWTRTWDSVLGWNLALVAQLDEERRFGSALARRVVPS